MQRDTIRLCCRHFFSQVLCPVKIFSAERVIVRLVFTIVNILIKCGKKFFCFRERCIKLLYACLCSFDTADQLIRRFFQLGDNRLHGCCQSTLGQRQCRGSLPIGFAENSSVRRHIGVSRSAINESADIVQNVFIGGACFLEQLFHVVRRQAVHLVKFFGNGAIYRLSFGSSYESMLDAFIFRNGHGFLLIGELFHRMEVFVKCIQTCKLRVCKAVNAPHRFEQCGHFRVILILMQDDTRFRPECSQVCIQCCNVIPGQGGHCRKISEISFCKQVQLTLFLL